jgi:hypothetical protein
VVFPVRLLAFLVAVPRLLAAAALHERSWVEVLVDFAAAEAASVKRVSS